MSKHYVFTLTKEEKNNIDILELISICFDFVFLATHYSKDEPETIITVTASYRK